MCLRGHLMRLFYNKSVIIILLIFTFSLGVRLCYLGLYEEQCPLFYRSLPGGDPLVYTEWSEKLLRGNLVGIDKPVYAAFCALARLCFPDFSYGIRISQVVLGALSCVLIYFVGKVLLGKTAGVISGIISAFYGPFVFYTGEILGVTVHLFLFVLT